MSGPDAGRQPIGRAVRPRYHLGLIGERLDGDDGAEYLTLYQFVRLAQAGHDRRLEIEAGEIGLAAAGDDLSVRGPPVQEALDPLSLTPWPAASVPARPGDGRSSRPSPRTARVGGAGPPTRVLPGGT
jgi:hypothetical protein